ncbi:MAG: large subunit ribosomal protein L5 [Planctomycetota bacterium]|jgi:large subunit ribosomal protein L5
MTETTLVPRLREKYESEIAPALTEKFNLKNPHQIAALQKIVVNMGVGKAIENKKRIDAAARDLGVITGQKPEVCMAKNSVAGFKVREGWPVGCRVTLRGDRMYEFMDRLFTLAIPRMRDFRGIKDKSFDGRGNFSMGLADQLVFPEINVDKVDWNQGMDITFVMTGGDDAMSFELLKQLGMPFRKNTAEVR